MHPAGTTRAALLCYVVPMTLEDIQQAIARLAPNDRMRLRRWLAELDAPPEHAPAQEKTAEKLGRLAGRAFADLKKRLNEP
jgi:hypothetical protein